MEKITFKKYFNEANKIYRNKSSETYKTIHNLFNIDKVLYIETAEGNMLGNGDGASQAFADYASHIYKLYGEEKLNKSGIPVKKGPKEQQNPKSKLIKGTNDRWVLSDYRTYDLMYKCVKSLNDIEPELLDKYYFTYKEAIKVDNINENTSKIQISWVDFYQEFADVLLKYKNNRNELIVKVIDIFKNIDLPMPTLEKDNKIVDIDPFTIFATFNKGLKDENRFKIIKSIKKIFNIKAAIPQDFNGIPLVNNMSATFYYFIDDRGDNDIDDLWALFEVAIKYSENPNSDLLSKFNDAYNNVSKKKGIKSKLTIGLFWTRPYSYISLDSRNSEFIIRNNMLNSEFIKDSIKDGFIYANCCNEIKRQISNNIEYKTFPELSYKAWIETTQPKENDGFWPSLDEYNPELTKDDWVHFINEVESIKHPSPMKMLVAMLELGGQASCKQLSEVYGGTPNAYIGCTSNLGRRVKKYFDKPGCIDDGQERLFTLPFQGKSIASGYGEHYVYRMRPELKAALAEIDLSAFSPYYDENEGGTEEMRNLDFSKNTILYGPPGTGKTYATVVYAVAIIENKSVEDVSKESYDVVFERYNQYKAEGLIAFTTFHQSYGYEEFIEGIKPSVTSEDDTGNIQYSIEAGIFKKFCERAMRPIDTGTITSIYGINDNPNIWKVSLWSTGDNEVRTECMENDHIRIGWDQYGKDISDETDFSHDGGRVVLNAFINRMEVGDIVFSCYSASTIDAIGVVTGEYEWHEEYKYFKRLRKVKWIVKGIRENILEINGGTALTLASVYRLSNISMLDVYQIINMHIPAVQSSSIKDTKNYVFIIDEINRGNISKIFGELITLIEDTKRAGMNEEASAILPYSGKSFSVPSNVYILGTMNTADRSIALMDTALRRRFEFIEMMPDADVLRTIGADKIEDLDVAEMLEKINERITFLYDREHTIGHAFFTKLAKNNSIDTLKLIFEKSVIPLLQEYFYEDYQKIQLVLGDNGKSDDSIKFIVDTDVKVKDIFKDSVDDVIDLPEKKYSINTEAFSKIESYKQII